MRPKPVTWCNLLNGVGCLAMFQDNFFRYIISRKKKDIWMLRFSKGNLTTVRKREKYPHREVSCFYAKWCPNSEFTQCVIAWPVRII